MSTVCDVIVAGHLCLDVIPVISGGSIGEIFRPGKLVNVGPAVISTGGPVSNTGIGLRKLGMNVAFVARVGDDDFGGLAIERLRREGNADGISVSSGQSTSYTVALASPCFDRIFLHFPGTNDTFTGSDIKDDVLHSARHFHLGYPPLMKALYENEGAGLIEVFKKAKAAGLTTSLDMTLPDPASESGKVNWREILTNLLPFVDIFLPSIEEAFFMLDPEKFLRMKETVGGAELIDHLTAEDYKRIYLAQGITDMRKSIDGLAAVVSCQFKLDPFADCWFVFCNRRRDKLKILHWEHNGFWLYYRRLERGQFKWPRAGSDQPLVISRRQLGWLLDGLTLEQTQAHREVLARKVA